MFWFRRVALVFLALAFVAGGMGITTQPVQASGYANSLYVPLVAGARTWSFVVTNVVQNTTVTIQSYNFPSNVWFKVRMGRYGTGGYDWRDLPNLDTGNGGSANYTFNIPAEFSGAGQLVLRLVQNKKNGNNFSQDQVFANVTGSGMVVRPAPAPVGWPDFGPNLQTYPPVPGSNWRYVMSDSLVKGFWPEKTGRNMSMQYDMGGYLITNDTPETIVFSTRSETYHGVRVDVTGQRTAGPMNGYYGILCNFADGANYYILAVGTDGWYGIGRKSRGKLTFLAEGWDVGAVGTSGARNALRADCLPGSQTLWSNGRLLVTTNDLTFSGGAVGLGVGNRQTGGMQALFNDFAVFQSVR
jgi:hypothetical protein